MWRSIRARRDRRRCSPLASSDADVTAGDTVRGTAGIFAPAPTGGAVVKLKSNNPSVVQVPDNVRIAAGNSANSFTITTGSVPIETSVRIDATLGGVTKSVFLNVQPNPDDDAVTRVHDDHSKQCARRDQRYRHRDVKRPSARGWHLRYPSTGNSSVAQVPAVVSISGGQTSANFTVTTFPVPNTTVVTITGFYGSGVKSANLTVTKP